MRNNIFITTSISTSISILFGFFSIYKMIGFITDIDKKYNDEIYYLKKNIYETNLKCDEMSMKYSDLYMMIYDSANLHNNSESDNGELENDIIYDNNYNIDLDTPIKDENDNKMIENDCIENVNNCDNNSIEMSYYSTRKNSISESDNTKSSNKSKGISNISWKKIKKQLLFG